MTPNAPPEFRAWIARLQIRRYELTSRVSVNPGLLGRMLNEAVAMPPTVAERVAKALKEYEQAGVARS